MIILKEPMSRSKKKTQIQGIASTDSEKEDKRDANRKLRRKTKQMVKKGEEQLPDIKRSPMYGLLRKMAKHTGVICQKRK